MTEKHQPRMSVEGVNGQIELHDRFLIITRRGIKSFLTHGLDGAKFIFLKAITGIQFKTAGHLTSGYIQFVFQDS
jgi:hypothetical protein